MRYFEPNVVVVDDKPEEVQGIIDYYRQSGVGCKYFNAEQTSGDVYPEKKMSDVMILFLDLYYSDQPGYSFEPEFPVSWVRSVIPRKAFYILVLWTKDPAQAQVVLDKLAKIERKPYLHIVENKGSYPGEPPVKYDYERLLKSINDKIEEVSALDEILIWKNSLKKTSNVVLGGLLSNNPADFTHKLKKVIKGHGGNVVLSNDPIMKRSVLFEALNHVLASNVPRYDSENEISDKNIRQLYDLSGIEAISIDSQLNSWFHFSMKDNLRNLTFPGMIAKNNSSHCLEYYSIKKDQVIKDFLCYQQGKEDLIIEDIVVNITRPCDYAQKKYGNNLKFLSGVAIKNPVRKEGDQKEIKLKKPVPDCVKHFDHLSFDDCQDVALIFDFRYCFSIPEAKFLSEFENVKMLNKELLTEIQVYYSSYVSRPGYTRIF